MTNGPNYRYILNLKLAMHAALAMNGLYRSERLRARKNFLTLLRRHPQFQQIYSPAQVMAAWNGPRMVVRKLFRPTGNVIEETLAALRAEER